MRNQRGEQTWSESSEDERPAGSPGELEVGARVGPYVVEAALGEGGSAQVWRVRHAELGVARALKVLRRGHAEGGVRLAREARLQAEIEHAHVVGVHDVLDVWGRPALVMELSESGSLWDALQAGRLDEARALRVGRDVARGLRALHARGVVHRDVKPSNVLMMGAEGRAALTDFGVAREEGSEETKEGEVLGTPWYMAPEQLRATSGVGPAADMYAFGVMLYELLEGERPPQSVSHVTRRLEARPAEVAELIEGCLSPEPEARPDAGRALELLEQAQRGGRPGRAVVFGACALAASCLAAVWVGSRGEAEVVAPAPEAAQVTAGGRDEAAPLRRALERLGTDPGEVAALWRAASEPGASGAADALERALWDAGGDVRVIETREEIVDVFTTVDGARVVGLTTEGWIHVWDRETGERIFAKDSAAGVPLSAHLSGDGRLVAVVPHSARSTSGSRSQVRVLDLSTGKVVFTASNGDTTSATYFAFSPDSSRALTYANGRAMTVWDVRSGAQVGRLALGATNCSEGAAFGPSGERVATLGLDGVLRIYGEGLALVSESKVVGGSPYCVLHWGATGGIVANSGGELVRVDAATGEVVAHASGVGGKLEVGRDHVVAFDRDGVTVLDAETLGVEHELAHPKGILDVELDGSGEQIATAGVDGVVRVWSTRTGRLLRELEGHRSWVHALTGASGGGWELWSSGRDRTLRAWRLPEPEGAMFGFELERLRVAAKGRLVLGWGADEVSVHSLDGREASLELGEVPRALRASEWGGHVLARHRDHLTLHELGGEAEGRRLPVASGFGAWVVGRDPLRIVVANTGALRRVDVGEAEVSEVRWEVARNPSYVGQTRDGERVFMTSFDHSLTVWRVGSEEAGAEVFEMGCAQPSFIEPTGEAGVVVGDWSGCMERWDVATGRREARWEGHDDAITKIEQVASGWVSSSLDGTLRVWGADGGGRVLGRHDGGVLGFSVDGARVVSVGADGAIRSWSLEGAEPGPVAYIPSRPEGVWGEDGVVRVVDEDGLVWERREGPEVPWGNLRVCPETFDVVPVVPFPREGGPWAPEVECGGEVAR